MKDLLNHLYKFNVLSREQAKQILVEIGEGKHNSSQISSFLTVYIMRKITVEELKGFRDAMLELCIPIDFSGYDGIDIVGTGGDGKDAFNISTISSFVVAGAGVNVTKHGNYGVSSSVGSSNVLEHLGLEFTNDESKLKSMLDKAGFCMMHAPLFHPAMKHVVPIRKDLQVRTFFNILGPMINPSSPKKQFLGVYDLGIGRLYGYVYQNSDVDFAIVHSLDGYDEISLTSAVKLNTKTGEELLEPHDFGFRKFKQSDLHGGETIESAAKIFHSILQGHGTEAQQSVVLANAGMALRVARGVSLEEGIAQAKESIDSGKAYQVLKNLTA